MLTIKAGERLPNGAIIVVYKRLKDHEGVVLAIREDKTPEPYVTWRFDMSTGEAYWGHYFHASSFDKAYDDFLERARS